ncbi:MAG TPA: outer membrane beta-barrel protein [Vicinamibacterales bacterium]|nr:outer membrane beta-barrel protein [Vicinamibacterales bacterium]
MRRTRVAALMTGLLILGSTRAFADATLFLGTNTTPENRMTRGFAVGMSMLIVGFEFEYANSSQDETEGAPSLKTGMGNVLLQTPTEIFGLQPYFTAGAGVYRERLDAIDHQETNFTVSTGGGVKISLVGPIRLRLDYRAFKLAGGALNSPAHRIYAGLNLRF